MADIINQCCYTHIGSWTTVAQKGDFDQKYVGELSRHATLPGPEYGNDLNVFETVGFGDKFLIMRTQYGLRDYSTESGRSSMFSHGYLIDTNEEMFDPNIFLTVDKDNFCTNEEEASKVKTSFQRIENFTLKAAMSVAGLTKETFSKLIKCVYQLSVRSVNKQALFIKAKDEEQSLALLYCIYSALIHRYSKYLSSASVEYNFSDMRNIVFTKSVNASRKYFIPETGENNVLTPNVEKNIDALLFVDYGVRYFATTEAIQEYYSQFEKTIEAISSLRPADDDLLKIAHVMTADPVPSRESDTVSTDDALLETLSFISNYNETLQSNLVSKYIEKLHAEAIQRGLIKVEPPKTITPEIERPSIKETRQAINHTVDKHDSDISYAPKNANPNGFGAYKSTVYSNTASQCHGVNDSTLQSTESNRYLSNESQTKVPSSTLSTTLKPFTPRELYDIRTGILNYSLRGFTVFASQLDKVLQNKRVLSDSKAKDEIFDSIYLGIEKIVIRNIQNKQPAFNQNPLQVFERWGKELNILETKIQRYKCKLITVYWKYFTWKSFSLEKKKDYVAFSVENNGFLNSFSIENILIEKSKCVDAVIKLMDKASVCSPENWLFELNRICSIHSTRENKNELIREFKTFFVKYIVSQKSHNDYLFDDYVKNTIVGYAVDLNEEMFRKLLDAWKMFFCFPSVHITGDINTKKQNIALLNEFVMMDFQSNLRKQRVIEATYLLCVHLEKDCKYVFPFDYWLLVGCGYEGSPYRVFYENVSEYCEYEPAVKKVSAENIVKESILLSEANYINILLNLEAKNKSGFIKSLIKEVSGSNTSLGEKFVGIFRPRKK